MPGGQDAIQVTGIMDGRVDVVVAGGGIAGVSAGFFLAEAGRRVVLAEAENVLAYHTTGRSAALFFENYGPPVNRFLTRAGRGFFTSPPDGLADGPLLTARGAVYAARPDQLDKLEAEAGAGSGWRRLDADGLAELVPYLRPGRFAAGLWEPEAADIDVAALHQAFVRGMRREGARILTGSPVTALERRDGGWTVTAGERTFSCEVVVNAAGAWGDTVAERAGAQPAGLIPMRRTAFTAPGREEWAAAPLAADVEMSWYAKPDGGQMLCSLAEENPSPPGDVRPEEMDVALAIDRINAATKIGIRTVRSSWTGLRTFAPDRNMVIGFDDRADGFFWLAGQGGTGIQTAPGAGRLAASLITTGHPPPEMREADITAALSPARFRAGRE